MAACSLLTCFTDDSGAAKVEKEAAAINTAAMLGISFMIDSVFLFISSLSVMLIIR